VNKLVFKNEKNTRAEVYEASGNAWLNTKYFGEARVFNSESRGATYCKKNREEMKYFIMTTTGKYETIVMFRTYEEAAEYFSNFGFSFAGTYTDGAENG